MGGVTNPTPEIPVHLTAWSKEYLGWVDPRVIEKDTPRVALRPYVTYGDVVRIDYTMSFDPADERYLLVEYRKQEGFDRSLCCSGLIVTEIDNRSFAAGVVTNFVNNNVNRLEVNVIEADGLPELETLASSGDAGDQFPGTEIVNDLDGASGEPILAAICGIAVDGDRMVFDVYPSRNTCPERVAIGAVRASQAAAVETRREFVVEATLVNEGTNYFSDRRIALVGGDDDAAISVIQSAPIAFPPMAVGAAAAPSPDGPEPLSANLGKGGVARGVCEVHPGEDGEPTRVFRIKGFVPASPWAAAARGRGGTVRSETCGRGGSDRRPLIHPSPIRPRTCGDARRGAGCPRRPDRRRQSAGVTTAPSPAGSTV